MKDFIKVLALSMVLQILGVLIAVMLDQEIEYVAFATAAYAVAVLVVRGIA